MTFVNVNTFSNINNLFFSNRIVMRNFLRIRDGDRFWYERYLSDEVLSYILLVKEQFKGPLSRALIIVL